MPVTTYNYTIATDIVSGKLNEVRLREDIEASSITIALDGIARLGDGTVDVRFKDALPAADKTTLDGDTTGPCGGVIGDHTGEAESDPEHTSDGALRVKLEPGTPDTDPKFYLHRWTTAGAAGDEWFDVSPAFAGKLIQGVMYQIENPVYGDEIDVAFRSDGSNVPVFGPADTLIQSFGPCNVPQGAGWQKDKVLFDTTKQVPAGLKVSFKYTSADVTVHNLCVDFLMYE